MYILQLSHQFIVTKQQNSFHKQNNKKHMILRCSVRTTKTCRVIRYSTNKQKHTRSSYVYYVCINFRILRHIHTSSSKTMHSFRFQIDVSTHISVGTPLRRIDASFESWLSTQIILRNNETTRRQYILFFLSIMHRQIQTSRNERSALKLFENNHYKKVTRIDFPNVKTPIITVV